MDALSHLPDSIDEQTPQLSAVAVFEVQSDPKLICRITKGYWINLWCKGILDNLNCSVLDRKLNITLKHGLIFIRSHLIIPKYKNLWEHLFQLAHNNLGHFRMEKSYANLWDDYYWPNMRRDLAEGYVPGCIDCQRNKGSTKPPGLLHPLPMPDAWFDSAAIDFIGLLPKDEGFDAVVTMTDRLGADIQIIPCNTTTTAKEFAFLFFDRWYCENGCPLKIISDQDKVFVSNF